MLVLSYHHYHCHHTTVIYRHLPLHHLPNRMIAIMKIHTISSDDLFLSVAIHSFPSLYYHPKKWQVFPWIHPRIYSHTFPATAFLILNLHSTRYLYHRHHHLHFCLPHNFTRTGPARHHHHVYYFCYLDWYTYVKCYLIKSFETHTISPVVNRHCHRKGIANNKQFSFSHP